MKNRILFSRPVFSWAMYDFANSAFATSFLSVIFGVYFTNVLVPKSGILVWSLSIPGESLWSYLISSVMLCVVFFAPWLGTIADQKSIKRPLLITWAIVGSLATMATVYSSTDRLLFVCVLVFLATLGFEMSLVFYNAFLKEITDDETSGRVSGFGFALGYLGGGLCLLLNLMMIKYPTYFGFDPSDSGLPVRYGMFVVGIWWMVFAIPTFLWVKDAPRDGHRDHPSRSATPLETWRWIRSHPSIFRFLIAYLIYEDGTQTVLLMASIFGSKALDMSPSDLALCYLMIQFVAFVGALIAGRIADFWSHKKVVLVTLFVFAGVVIWAVFMRRSVDFWILGVVVGLIMGGNQAASRSFFSSMIPKEKSTELFALFSIVGKAAAFVGPLVFGIVSQFFGLRAAVGALSLFFIIGGTMLFTVNDKKKTCGLSSIL